MLFRSRTAKFHKEAEILFYQIDRHFLRALAQRKVSAKRESPSSESRGQALAEVALAQKERLLEGMFYGGAVRDFILRKGLAYDPAYFRKAAQRLAEQYPEQYPTPEAAMKDLKKGNALGQVKILDDYLSRRSAKAPESFRNELLWRNLVSLPRLEEMRRILKVSEDEWREFAKKVR